MPKQAIAVILEDKNTQAGAGFHRKCKDKPEFVHTCCHRMLFKKIGLKVKEEHH